jgi:hypothetical protein
MPFPPAPGEGRNGATARSADGGTTTAAGDVLVFDAVARRPVDLGAKGAASQSSI